MHAKKTNKTKVLAVVLALVLLVGGAIGGTLAWLIDDTDPVVNVFTESDVDITLTETTGNSYKMVPGATITKDPVVTVLADSEACWLFVKIVAENGVALKTVEENYPAGTYLVYEVADDWTPLAGATGVYYRGVSASDADQPFPVLAGDKVTVLGTVTKEMMDALNADNYPKLTFTAYAIQQSNGTGIFEPADAWAKITTPAT